MNFYWLKSVVDYTEIILIILFVVHLIIKYNNKHITIRLFLSFLTLKLLVEVYCFFGYTDWIIEKYSFFQEYRLAIPFIELIYSPLLFFITLSILKEGFVLKLKHYLQFSTAIIFLFWFVINADFIESQLIFVFMFVRLYFLFYVTLSIYYLKVKDENKVYKNLLYMFIGFLLWNLFWSLEFYGWQVFNLFDKSFAWIIYLISEFIFLFSLVYFFYSVITNSKLLPLKIKKRNLLPENKIELIGNKINHALNTDKLFKNPDLNLKRFAKEISVTPNEITNFTNSILNKNFSKLIIEYRIKESQYLLKKYSTNEKTIETIMYESGFNSKSVFYTAFKKETGMTPKTYRLMF
ncbi:MAG: AraC family transcriptional regulator [Flavobacteriaceae bacterium]|nr:AraC family transcriptional regulator [Flavobacteriaceae bacterium]